MKDVNSISFDVVGEAIRIHQQLGPGLLESVYEAVVFAALVRKGYQVARQVAVPVEFDGIAMDVAFRVDILVERSLVIEVKSVEQLTKLHAKQLLTYLRLLKQPLGLLLNFSGMTMKEGIRRMVNDHHPEV